MSGSIELGTDSILSLRRGGGKGHITAIALLNNLSYIPKQFSTLATGWFRGVGIRNLWEKEDLNEPNPPGEFTLEEPKTLGPTRTSTGWLMMSLCSKMLLQSPS